MEPNDIIKRCPMCRNVFTLRDVVEHADIRPIGMTFEEGDFANNAYYFNHTCPGCGSTFAIPVEQFLKLIDEEIPAEVLAGTASCEHHCRKVTDLSACSQPCHYAPFRRFLINRLLPRAAHG